MATILITGSNSGFGRLASLTLARGGHDVIATMRTPSKGEDLQRLADDEGLSIETGRLLVESGGIDSQKSVRDVRLDR